MVLASTIAVIGAALFPPSPSGPPAQVARTATWAGARPDRPHGGLTGRPHGGLTGRPHGGLTGWPHGWPDDDRPADAVAGPRWRAQDRPAVAGNPRGAAAEPCRGPAGEVAGDTGRVLYLTFDDGPDARWTPQILALLARYRATATFFQVGTEVRRRPQLAAQVRAAGHRVGNHTANHAHLTRLTRAQASRQIAGGVPGAACLRPPYGQVNAVVRSVAARAGQRLVLWTVDTQDWAEPGAGRVLRRLLAGARPGAVILMHDGGGDRRQTLAALRAALPRLAARGYRFRSHPAC
jgi:peptidoglycan-N-acetylglucosamine deacetylase